MGLSSAAHHTETPHRVSSGVVRLFVLALAFTGCAMFDNPDEVDMSVPPVRLVYNTCPAPQKPPDILETGSSPYMLVEVAPSKNAAPQA